MNQIKTIDGHLNAADLKFAILATRFNDFIVDRLVGGAVDYLIRHGGSEENLTIVRVPGAFEMPLACKKLAASGKYDGIVAVGAVIRGGTPHFDFVAAEATKGLAHVSLESGVPVGLLAAIVSSAVGSRSTTTSSSSSSLLIAAASRMSGPKMARRRRTSSSLKAR